MCRKKYVILAKAYDKRGRLLAVGLNSYRKTSTVQRHYAILAGLPEKEYLHSEIQALLRCKDKTPYRLTVERYTNDGEPALAAPCPVCSLAIRTYGVKVLEYTSSEGWVKEIL